MNNPALSEEFIGRIGVSYRDGETIYAYDEITHGLYRFNLDLREVNMIISPMNIHWNNGNRVIGISKRKNEIILVPKFPDAEWIFYDEKEKKIQYKSVVKNNIRISSVITYGVILFLIPSVTYDPIIEVSLDCMKITHIYRDWYENHDSINTCIWGASFYRESLVFPIVNTKEIVCMRCDSINMIIPDIPNPILSVSIYEDKIWILPVSGNHIYSIDFDGEIMDRIDICQAGVDISVDGFSRILAIEDTVLLFPIQSEKLYVYQLGKKKMGIIRTGRTPLRGSLFLRTNTSYWDFVIDNKMLYLLPCEYRYKRVHIPSLKCEEYSLYFENNAEYQKYWVMVRYIQSCDFVENRGNDFLDFFQYVQSRYENHFIEKKGKIGRKIWINII